MSARVVSLHAGGAALRKAPVARLDLLEGVGALGDRHAGKDADRAVLITPLATYRYLKRLGLALACGALGENLVIAGLDPHRLPPGTRLKLGEAVLELTRPCTVCSSLSRVDLRLPKLVFNRRGVYARVVTGGSVSLAQRVTVLPPPAPAVLTGALPQMP